MYQYEITRVLRLTNSDTLTVEVDLGFRTRTEVTFRLSGLKEPELDLSSGIDQQADTRRAIINWLQNAPGPLLVHTYKDGTGYTGSVLDKNGNILNEALQKPVFSDKTVVMDYGLPKATTSPS